MILIYFALILFFLIFLWHFTTLNWRDKYTLTFCFGRKGQGKSTLLARDAYEGLKENWTVYSQELLSFKIKDKVSHKKVVKSTIPFEPDHIYDYTFPAGSLILIDEASLIWSNRDFSLKSKQEQLKRTIEWFQQQRKLKCKVILYSVSFDIDKKIRDMCDRMVLVRKYFRVLSVGRILHREPIVVHPLGDAPASIQEDILEEPPIKWVFGGIRVTFIPKWAKYFDSFRMVVDTSETTSSLSADRP